MHKLQTIYSLRIARMESFTIIFLTIALPGSACLIFIFYRTLSGGFTMLSPRSFPRIWSTLSNHCCVRTFILSTYKRYNIDSTGTLSLKVRKFISKFPPKSRIINKFSALICKGPIVTKISNFSLKDHLNKLQHLSKH